MSHHTSPHVTPLLSRRQTIRASVLLIAISLVWALGAYSYQSLRNVAATNVAAVNAQDLRYQAERVLSLLKDAETSTRGFVMIGDEAYLEPYNAALDETSGALSRLRTLVAEEASQKERLARLEPLVSEQLALLAGTIELRRTRQDMPIPRERLDRGKAIMDEARDLVGLMVAKEEADYQAIKAEAETHAQGSMVALLAGIALGSIMVTAVFAAMIREAYLRQAAEAALRAANDRLEQRVSERTAEIERNRRFLGATLANMKDAVFVNKGGKIIYANDAFVKLVGAADFDDLQGQALIDFFHADDHALIKRRVRVLKEADSSAPTVEERVIRLDGEIVPVEVNAASFLDNDDCVILVMLRDISAKRAAELQLRRAQRLEAVGQLTGGMAHDFNNLLGVIIGNLDLLEDDLKDRPNSAELAQMALKASLRGAELTKKLLAFSRRQSLEPSDFDLNQLAVGTTDLLRRTLGEETEISLELAGELWPAHADQIQVESALLNLAINARDAMPKGGRLTIETADVTFDEGYAAENTEVTPGDYVMLAVSDTGTGIPPEVLSHVFEPFFTTKNDGKGSGLGLAMIYGFVKQSGGHIKIYSEVGHGATVRLYFPRAAALDKAGTAEHADDKHAARQPARILVVDDNADIRRVAVRLVTELGYQAIEAENGAAALEILQRNQAVDLLFTDIVMPGGLMGDELAEKARELRPNLKVLFTSGFAEASIENGGRSAKIQRRDLLSKPYRRQDLARRIGEALADKAA